MGKAFFLFFATMDQQSLDQAAIVIFTPAIIIGQGFKWQFEQWGFARTKLVTTPEELPEAAQTILPALVLLDGESAGNLL